MLLTVRESEHLISLEKDLREEWKIILLQEESLWSQKSRVDWLRAGDENTKYFHTSTLIGRRRNKILALKNDEDQWVEDREDLKHLAVEFYGQSFSANREVNADFIRGHFLSLEEQCRNLEKDVPITETKKALNDIGSWKALGPDSFQAGFYKNTWEVAGLAVHNFVQRVMKGEAISEEAGEALLVLIPKEANPSSIKRFRPISLCNVYVKLITKVIANRLKPLFKDIIASMQTSFIRGRQGLDNAIICQEVVHTRKYTKAKKSGMVLKIDLEKVFDYMEWGFVRYSDGSFYTFKCHQRDHGSDAKELQQTSMERGS